MSRRRSRSILLAVLLGVWAYVLWGQFKGRATASEPPAAAAGEVAPPPPVAPSPDSAAAPAGPRKPPANYASTEVCAAQDRADVLPMGADPFFKDAAPAPAPAPVPAPVLAPEPGPASEDDAPKAPATSVPERWALTSTFVQGARSVAVINGRRWREGDTLGDGVRLARIGAGWVEIEESGATCRIALPRPQKATPAAQPAPAQP